MQDKDYISGLEDGVGLVKRIYELGVNVRKKMFGCEDVAQIIDRFDFAQINEILKAKKDKIKELHTFYIIRGIKVDTDGTKKVTIESEKYNFYPTWEQMESFMRYHTLPIANVPQVDFAVVETIWVYE